MGSGQSTREDERKQQDKQEKKREDDRIALERRYKRQDDLLQTEIARENNRCNFEKKMQVSRDNEHKHHIEMLTDGFKEQRAQDEQRRKQERTERAEQTKSIVNAIKHCFLATMMLMAVGIFTYLIRSVGKPGDIAEDWVTRERVMEDEKILKLLLQFEQHMRAKEQAEMPWTTTGGTLLVTLILLAAVIVRCSRGRPAPGKLV